MIHSEILSKGLSDSIKYSDMKKLINNITKSKLPFNDLLLECGMCLYVNRQDLQGENIYQMLEAMLHASIENKQWTITKVIESILYRDFEADTKIIRNNATFLNALGKRNKAKTILTKLVQENLFDYESLKRRIAILRAEDNINQVITELNKYLEENCLDKEAWLELADIYMEHMNYEKALFCFEELLIIDPENLNNMMRVAELYYTIGNTVENQTYARKYFSFILLTDENSLRAAYNLKTTCKVLIGMKKDTDGVCKELLEYASSRVEDLTASNKSS